MSDPCRAAHDRIKLLEARIAQLEVQCLEQRLIITEYQSHIEEVRTTISESYNLVQSLYKEPEPEEVSPDEIFRRLTDPDL